MIINRPGRKFSGPKSDYIKVKTNAGMQNVMLDSEVVDNWDVIKTLEIEAVTYSQKTVDGKLVDEEWSRLEVIDFQTTTREFILEEHQAKLDNLRKGIVTAPLSAEQFAAMANVA